MIRAPLVDAATIALDIVQSTRARHCQGEISLISPQFLRPPFIHAQLHWLPYRVLYSNGWARGQRSTIKARM